MTTRIEARFAKCRAEGRAALVTYVMAGDPDPETSLAILKSLPKAGADIVEFGLPFTDPMADGPAIQAAGLRALKAGQNTVKTLDLVRRFRDDDADTPVILMGYFNPIHTYGVRPLPRRRQGGRRRRADRRRPAAGGGRRAVPAGARRPASPSSASPRRRPTTSACRRFSPTRPGFVYYVSITGITGVATPDFGKVATAVERIKRHTPLPVVVGFGVKSGAHAAAVAEGPTASWSDRRWSMR